GGFGAKTTAYPEYIATARASQLLGRPVRYVETRTESLVTMNHGRAQVQDVELGLRSDGTIVGLRCHVVADVGAYPGLGVILPTLTHQMCQGVYRIPKVHFTAQCVTTNTTFVAAY